jgi:hypothetical protein
MFFSITDWQTTADEAASSVPSSTAPLDIEDKRNCYTVVYEVDDKLEFKVDILRKIGKLDYYKLCCDIMTKINVLTRSTDEELTFSLMELLQESGCITGPKSVSVPSKTLYVHTKDTNEVLEETIRHWKPNAVFSNGHPVIDNYDLVCGIYKERVYQNPLDICALTLQTFLDTIDLVKIDGSLMLYVQCLVHKEIMMSLLYAFYKMFKKAYVFKATIDRRTTKNIWLVGRFKQESNTCAKLRTKLISLSLQYDIGSKDLTSVPTPGRFFYFYDYVRLRYEHERQKHVKKALKMVKKIMEDYPYLTLPELHRIRNEVGANTSRDDLVAAYKSEFVTKKTDNKQA